LNFKKILFLLARWVPVILWMVVIYTVSSNSYPYRVIPSDVSIPIETIGRVAHIFEYAILAVLTGRAILLGKKLSPRDVINIFLFSISYAMFDEFHQNMVPERSFQFLDLGLDVVGTLLGTGFIAYYFSLTSRKQMNEGKIN
jgi:VanZ family protein